MPMLDARRDPNDVARANFLNRIVPFLHPSYCEDAYAKASGTKDKELFKLDGATHIGTHWVPEYVDSAIDKLTTFYERTL